MIKHFSMNSFIIGVMCGALLTGTWFFSDNLSIMLTPPPLTTSTKVSTQSNGAISVLDQSFGDTVIVESGTVPPPGVWVAVREVHGNNLGNVLGAVRITGPRSHVSVPLLRATEAERAYAVELYRDNNGDFDVTANSVYVDFDTGARVVAYFSTTE